MIVIFWFVLSFAVGAWAGAWDRNPGGWALLALIISPLLGALFLLIAGRGGKVCPKCAEKVRREAVVCKHCGHDFNAGAAPNDPPPDTISRIRKAMEIAGVLAIAVCIAPAARAGDYAFCLMTNRVANEAGLRGYNDTQIRNGLCLSTKETVEAIAAGNEIKEAICTETAKHVLREFMRRFPGADPAQTSGKC